MTDKRFSPGRQGQLLQSEIARDVRDLRLKRYKALEIQTDVTNFDNLLSATDTDVQLALETLDDHTHGVLGTWAPSYTGITIGNGVVTTEVVDIGPLVYFSWELVCGTTTVVTAQWAFSLPATPSSSVSAHGWWRDVSASPDLLFHLFGANHTEASTDTGDDLYTYSGIIPATDLRRDPTGVNSPCTNSLGNCTGDIVFLCGTFPKA